MFRIIFAGSLGWAAIVAIAYRLASARIAICYIHDNECLIRTTATRDNVLVAGLTVALVAFVLLALIAARRTPRLSRAWQPTNRARSQAPRSLVHPQR